MSDVEYKRAFVSPLISENSTSPLFWRDFAMFFRGFVLYVLSCYFLFIFTVVKVTIDVIAVSAFLWLCNVTLH